MKRKATFGIGEYWCLSLAEQDLAAAVKKAHIQGFSYVVKYEDTENKNIHVWRRTIIGWNVEQISFDEASLRYKDCEDISNFIKDAFRKGMKFFIVAPYSEGCEIFPKAYFEDVQNISKEDLEELLK